MQDEDRKWLYSSLLRGMGNIAQDRLCAADKQHAWGSWFRYVVQKDIPIGPVNTEPPTVDETYRVAARRTCQNCGKEQFDAG